MVAHSACADGRYVAVFESGERVGANRIDGWARPSDSPSIDGRPLFDEGDPLRWLVDTQPVERMPAADIIEFFSGDRLPAVVVGYSPGATSPYRPAVPPHLVVRPVVPLKDSRNEDVRQLRIRPEMVRRWWTGRYAAALLTDDQRGDAPVSAPPLEPSTAETVDGRRFAVRRARFAADGLTLLSETGLERIAYEQLAEYQFPSTDPWPLYYDELAALSPGLSNRLVQLEASGGLVATTSVERYRPLSFNDTRRPDRWHHLIHPAWSLDAFAVPHGEVRSRCYFSPDRVPLSHVAAVGEKNDSAVHPAWRAQFNRNAYGGPLQSSGKAFGWGLGVHGQCELAFPLPACVTGFESRVGIDDAAFGGGRARASVVIRRGDRTTSLWSSDELYGWKPAVQCDAGEFAPDLISPSSPAAQLVLSVDSLPDAAGESVDPLDLRDAVDWLEPALLLDREALLDEVAQRRWQSIPALDGWTIVAPEEDAQAAPELIGHWDAELGRGADYRRAMRFRDRVVLQRRVEVPSIEAQLVVFAGRHADSAKARLNIEAEGSPLANREIALRYTNEHEPPPIVARLGPWNGKTINVRLIVSHDGEVNEEKENGDLIVDWRSIELRSEPLPPIPGAFDSEPPVATVFNDRSKDVLNRWLELRVMLSEQLDDDACRLLAETPNALLLAPIPHPDDESRSITLAELLPGLTADHPGLEARMRERYAGVSELRLDRAIAGGDPFRVRMVTVQFPGTAAAARARAWLGDRALSQGDFAAAAELYHRALAEIPASLRRQVATRLELAEKMSADDP